MGTLQIPVLSIHLVAALPGTRTRVAHDDAPAPAPVLQQGISTPPHHRQAAVEEDLQQALSLVVVVTRGSAVEISHQDPPMEDPAGSIGEITI